MLRTAAAGWNTGAPPAASGNLGRAAADETAPDAMIGFRDSHTRVGNPLPDALIGHTGFVGGALLRQRGFEALFNSRNVEAVAGGRFGLLVFAGAQAKKWWANQNPEQDWAGIARALGALRGVEAARAVLISTIDVLPEGDGVDEAAAGLDPGHAYGRNRLRLEVEFRRLFPHALVVRLPGLFGPGLRKNVIFDLLNGNMLEQINPASRFQWYDLERLWADVGIAARGGLELIHLFPEPVPTGGIVTRFFPGAAVGTKPAPAAVYDHRTRHAALFGGRDGYLYGADETWRRLAAFIEAQRP